VGSGHAGVAVSAVTVVIITRDRRDGLLQTLRRLQALPERPPVVVVDNGSTDGTVAAVRASHPDVELVALGRNLGAAGRNVGACVARTRYVAFSDDDSSWAPGALTRAVDLLDAHPRLALVAAKVLVGDEGVTDPTCEAMARSPLPHEPDLPGSPVLGFIACGAVVHRERFLAVGFDERCGVGGEEALLAIDLAGRGWGLAYVDEVVALHWPSPARDPRARRAVVARNDLVLAWSRRHWSSATATTLRSLARAARDDAVRAGLLEAVRRAPQVLRERRPVSGELERRLRLLG
jgi:GT2 family glycosyltransferase